MDIIKVGKAIAYLRKRAGYTQKELADRVGISDKAVSKWERGQGLPEIGYLRKLSILLDTDTDSLLAGDVAHHRSDWTGVIVLDENPYGIYAGTMIYDKPLINFLLSYFLLVGIKEIYIACTVADAKYINAALDNGSDYGICITTVVGGMKEVAMVLPGENMLIDGRDCIDTTDGNAYVDIQDALDMVGAARTIKRESKVRAESSVKRKMRGNIMLVYGRCILYGVDQTRFFQKAMVDREHLTMLVLPKKMQKISIAVDMDMRVVNDRADDSKKLRTQYDFSEIPILFFPASILSSVIEAPSIAAFIEEQIAHENMFVETLDRGFVEIEADDWNSVQEAATFMKIVQNQCGMNVYCLEEVAWRRGMISLARLKELGERKTGTEYGEYVLGLYDRLIQRVVEE